MRIDEGKRVFAPTDLNTFLGCRYATTLALAVLEGTRPKTRSLDPMGDLVKAKGLEHERAALARFRHTYLDGVVEIAATGSFNERQAATDAALASGAPVVYQAALGRDGWAGYADFLIRDGAEAPPRYEPYDTKLARSVEASHVVQLSIYADLLAGSHISEPERLHVLLGDGRQVTLPAADVAHYVRHARARLERFSENPPTLVPEPCAACAKCDHGSECAVEWERIDHLSLVANIRKDQIGKLEGHGITTLAELAALPDGTVLRGLVPDTLAKLVAQARLQHRFRTTGERCHELIEAPEGRGFARLPKPDPHDLFLDLEGDPLHPGGLEYLIGLLGRGEDGSPRFTAYWAHDHEAERAAFEAAVDHIAAVLRDAPGAYIYHYAPYEVTAFRRLASHYGTREAIVDDWFRRHRFVDLYAVVREAIRISEPRYSLKNVELFFASEREEDVTSASDSIVEYERWRQLRDPAILEALERYNERDVRSTSALRDWLLTLRPTHLAWFEGKAPEAEPVRDDPNAALIAALVAGCPPAEHPLRELAGQLLGFHAREAKPEWWAMFDRQLRPDDELIDDAECLGSLERVGAPRSEKRSYVYSYRFPEQDTKLRLGSDVREAATLQLLGKIKLFDEEARLVELSRGKDRDPPPCQLSLIPKGPLGTDAQKAALRRFAAAIHDGTASRYGAVLNLLRREPPDIAGHAPGCPLISHGVSLVNGTIDAVARMSGSCLVIQGPPGAGKTYTAARAIVALIAAGKRVGVTSNSHKAIHNLLEAVENAAIEQGVRFRGLKRGDRARDNTHFDGRFVTSVFEDGDVDLGADLIAGTSWLFSCAFLDRALDYLFVDEVGQVALANVVAMGLSALNLVLVGDQMQLGQPIQGSHPGSSGVSVLEHLLHRDRVIAPDRGIFLGMTWRMHPKLCRFVSDAVYERQLHPEAGTANQQLRLGADPHLALRPAGLSFWPVDHYGCGQKSEDEGHAVLTLVRDLLRHEVTDRDAITRPMTLADILVVAPYNVQVNHLRSVLPDGAKVGTVDRFQGQEAEVVIVSMTTSSGAEMPRNIEFLFSRNRLNVALSRAKCLSIVVASPRLLEVECRTVEQLQLVNTLCWAASYAALP